MKNIIKPSKKSLIILKDKNMKKEKETIGDKIYKRKECMHRSKDCAICHLVPKKRKPKQDED